MNIDPVTSQEAWDALVQGISPNTFLHSWHWGEIQLRLGHTIERLEFTDQGESLGVALLVHMRAKRGSLVLCPHGPLVKKEEYIKEVLRSIVVHVKSTTKGYSALRLAPLLLDTKENNTLLQEEGFKPSPLHVHAELTWVLDISGSKEDILKGMRKTTRHAIKKADKEGVQVDVQTSAQALERFWPLYEQTSSRHNFVPYTKNTITTQIEEFGKSNQVFAVTATYQGKDVASAILFYYGDTAYYYHGASTHIQGNIPAAHAVQWSAIQEAKKRGATKYNFWGIAPDNEPNHPFAGITVFKKGFGGQAVPYIHAHDYPLSWRYYPLWIIETFRKYQRGF